MLDLARDWQVWDNVETVALTSYRQSGSSVQNVQALRRSLNAREKGASGGAYQIAGLVWFVPNVQVEVGTLKPRDTIEDEDGQVWTVQQTDLQSLRSVWKLTCLNLSIVYDLGDKCSIEHADLVIDPSGVQRKVYPPEGGKVLYDDLLCKVQVTDKESREERGIRYDVSKYEIILAVQTPNVSTEDRVKLSNGTYLEIRSYRSPDRLDELAVLEAESVP